ncbi:TPA: hypothetical protein ACH3X1_015616 [Trebouxia sp. C0004]
MPQRTLYGRCAIDTGVHTSFALGKGKGKVADLQKSKPKPEPAHAEVLTFEARQALMQEGKCSACKQKGHNKNDAVACAMHPRHTDAGADHLSAMQVDSKTRSSDRQ